MVCDFRLLPSYILYYKQLLSYGFLLPPALKWQSLVKVSGNSELLIVHISVYIKYNKKQSSPVMRDIHKMKNWLIKYLYSDEKLFE